MTPNTSILKKLSKSRPNILTFVTHERYSHSLKDVDANFYCLEGLGTIKKWCTEYGEVPTNHIILKQSNQLELPIDIEFDCILTQNKFAHHQIGAQIASQLRLPIVHIEHCLSYPQWDSTIWAQLNNMPAHINLFISEYNKNSWGCQTGSVVEHGIDSDLFRIHESSNRNQNILVVANDFINRDFECGYSLFRSVTEGLPVTIVGNTPNLSRAANSVSELVNIYNNHSIYLNTATHSPIPMVMLEAMACGCCPISVSNPMIESIIRNGKNGFVAKSTEELKTIINRMTNNKEECEKIGLEARKTILDRFSMSKFTTKWNLVFRYIQEYDIFYIPQFNFGEE